MLASDVARPVTNERTNCVGATEVEKPQQMSLLLLRGQGQHR